MLREKYVKSGQLLIVFAPVLSHADYSDQTHQAAECAAEQERFWEFHDLLFEHQDDFWEGDVQVRLKELAAEANLEVEQFNACLDEQRYFERIRSQDEFRQEAGIRGQPVFYINGDYLVGSQPLEVFEGTIEGKLGK